MVKVKAYMDAYGLLFLIVVLLFIVLIHSLEKENQKREKLYFTDPLTGGYNREGFLRQSMKNVDGKSLEAQVLVYMNVVDFRYINESWSEEDGNRTLQFIYQSLQKGLHGSELVCRSGMDHFFMLLNEPDDQAVADRIRKAIEEMNGQIQNKFIGFTIGACRLRENGNFSSLMNKVMFASKLAEEKTPASFLVEKQQVYLTGRHS